MAFGPTAGLQARRDASQACAKGPRRLGLVTLEQMVDTLVWAVENPPAPTQVLGVPEILNCGVRRAVRV